MTSLFFYFSIKKYHYIRGSPCRILAGSFEIDVDSNVKAAISGKGMKKRTFTLLIT